jgi:hypothetical protein
MSGSITSRPPNPGGTPYQHACVEPVVRRADIETSVLGEHVAQQLDQFLVVVHDQNFAFAAFQGIGRDAIVLHESVQLVPWNATEPAARHAEPLQRAVVETADDGLLAHLADLRRFARCENSFRTHGFEQSFLASCASP